MVKQNIIPLEDLFKAYYSCRKNKRNTTNALVFELNLEEELIQLKEELESGSYAISSSKEDHPKHFILEAIEMIIISHQSDEGILEVECLQERVLSLVILCWCN